MPAEASRNPTVRMSAAAPPGPGPGRARTVPGASRLSRPAVPAAGRGAAR
jgi:hypothetical protein